MVYRLMPIRYSILLQAVRKTEDCPSPSAQSSSSVGSAFVITGRLFVLFLFTRPYMVCGMHSPTFRLDHRLSDWPDCHLELRCQPCRDRSTVPPCQRSSCSCPGSAIRHLRSCCPNAAASNAALSPPRSIWSPVTIGPSAMAARPTGPLSWSPCLVSELCSLFGPLIALFFVPSLPSVQHGDG